MKQLELFAVAHSQKPPESFLAEWYAWEASIIAGFEDFKPDTDCAVVIDDSSLFTLGDKGCIYVKGIEDQHGFEVKERIALAESMRFYARKLALVYWITGALVVSSPGHLNLDFLSLVMIAFDAANFDSERYIKNGKIIDGIDINGAFGLIKDSWDALAYPLNLLIQRHIYKWEHPISSFHKIDVWPTIPLANAIEKAKEMMKAKKDTSGFVYVVESQTKKKYYKIGRSVDVKRRLKRLEVKLPFEIEPVILIETDDCNALESRLHRRYQKKRVEGEWFLLSAEDIAEIGKLSNSR